MAIFSKHKLELSALLREIPDKLLRELSSNTRVDYYSKVLTGKLMFYLLLYGMLYVDRLSQRGLRDAFSSPMFRIIFNYSGKSEISHSSISERLSVIDLRFFEDVYNHMYQRFSSLYTKKEIAGMHLQRVDSTLVKETCNKLKEGMTWGNQHQKSGKMIKYTLDFDGMFASFSSMHREKEYHVESLALSENVLNHFKKEKGHSSVYIFDRGMLSAPKFQEMKQEEGLFFVGRLRENRKLKEIEKFETDPKTFTQGVLVSDGLYQLYRRYDTVSKNGKISNQIQLVEEDFRVIRFVPQEGKEAILLITNIMDISAEEIAKMYRKRWDIEVFFRFLKQELNFSHFLSLNDNGIQVVLYMTLITAMLVMVYKKENQLGYKTAVRRMGIELEGLVIAIASIQNGGDLRKNNLPDP
jgi:FOG: Transposase and inactivated derivatives